MATISELMAGKSPGAIRVVDYRDTTKEWFEPYFLTEGTRVWVGKEQYGCHNVVEDTNNWIIYEEPKKTVSRWLYAKQNEVGTWITDFIFYTDLSASITLGPKAVKLISTCITVEE